MKPEQIPDEVVQIARTAAEKVYGTQFFNEEIEAALAAGLAAWPNSILFERGSTIIDPAPHIILPLKEISDS